MDFLEALPHVNAMFNALSACCLVVGFIAVKKKRISIHKRAMLSAFGFSAAFLVCYITKQALSGHVAFESDSELWRAVYITILVSHMLLAALVVPLSVTLVFLGLTGRIDRHKRMARWTFPIWMYTSVTGVIVYVMLYHLFVPS